MSRTILVLLSSTVLVACAGSHDVDGPPAMADDATGAFWSSRPAPEVAACLDALNGRTGGVAQAAAPDGGYTIRSANHPAVTYVVHDVGAISTAYPTQVDVFGEVSAREDQASSACMLPDQRGPIPR